MVNMVFADACYFLALSIGRDSLHQQALSLAAVHPRLLTTEWVLAEVAEMLRNPGLLAATGQLSAEAVCGGDELVQIAALEGGVAGIR